MRQLIFMLMVLFPVTVSSQSSPPTTRRSEASQKLLRAAQSGDIRLAQESLDEGADISGSDKFGRTALHGAVRASSPQLAQLLLKNGARIDAADHRGTTPLMELITVGRGRRAEMLRILLEYHPALDASDRFGRTALQLAVIAQDYDLISALITSGAKVDRPKSWSALHEAVLEKDEKALTLLLDASADVNAEDQGGDTPLHLAVEAASTVMVKLLIDRGARLRKNKAGLTPLELAKGRSNQELIRLLDGRTDR